MSAAFSVAKEASPVSSLSGALRRWPIAACVAIAALAVLETLNAATASRRAPSEADWSAATSDVVVGFQPGDLIVFAPRWTDQVGRLHLGGLMTPAMAGRSDDSHYGRIWEVSIRGARAPETQAPGARRLSVAHHGAVTVALFAKAPPVVPTFDFTEHLNEARVTQLSTYGNTDEDRPCFHDQGGFRCGATHIERRVMEVDYGPRQGVLVPVDGHLVTRIAFFNVPLGARLVGYAGLHDYYARKNSAAPCQLDVFVDGQKVISRTITNDSGWGRFEVDTSQLTGDSHVVRFEVQAADARWRNLGFHVEAVPAAAPVTAGAPQAKS